MWRWGLRRDRKKTLCAPDFSVGRVSSDCTVSYRMYVYGQARWKHFMIFWYPYGNGFGNWPHSVRHPLEPSISKVQVQRIVIQNVLVIRGLFTHIVIRGLFTHIFQSEGWSITHKPKSTPPLYYLGVWREMRRSIFSVQVCINRV